VVFATVFAGVSAWLAMPELYPRVEKAVLELVESRPEPPLAPQAVGIIPPVEVRDLHFSGCREAHAAGRYSIPAWDPSYRERMDGDGDGFACEPLPLNPRRGEHKPGGRVRVLR
jgi:hypothetical protein